ncbi:MAG: Rid family detoxifying hydrolase [Paracoccaceae bacterium]|jgi:2-iminobutanoate/2-iminopropanoate deaminase|nr:Rid family detoxifying hydrolase [Paracoccaceae bacterium]MDG1369059.1 Rid family detoxifying hydrolase [Paracoccaceae bacterium]
MSKKIIATTNAPEAAGPYSQATRAGGLVFVSGQLPLHPETGEMPESVADQTALSLANIEAILASEGLNMGHIVKCMVFITDMDQFGEMNAVYAGAFETNPPARSAYQVVRLPKDAKVEIEAIAVAD